MRLLPALVLAALAATAFSGCTSDLGSPSGEDVESPAAAPLEGQQFQGDASDGQAAGAGDGQTHGQFQRVDSEVESGVDPQQVPGAYARKTVTITNDFGGASRGFVSVSVDAGSIRVVPGAADGYRIEALLEGRGFTPQDASDNLARLELTHKDEMGSSGGLHLDTRIERQPDIQPVPNFSVRLAGNSWADVVVYLPAGPAYDLATDTGAGSIALQGLRGPSFAASTGSGDILASGLNAGTLAIGTGSGSISLDALEADHATLDTGSGTIAADGVRFGKARVDTGSGSIDVKGLVDTLEADTGSGSIRLEIHARETGSYTISTGSGSVDLEMLYGGGRAYRVVADAGSGNVEVDLPNSRTTSDEDDPTHVEAENRDFDDAPIRTVVAVETGSGDITVTA